MNRAEEKRRLNILRLKRQQWERHRAIMAPEERLNKPTQSSSVSTKTRNSRSGLFLVMNGQRSSALGRPVRSKEEQEATVNRLLESHKEKVRRLDEREHEAKVDYRTGRELFMPHVNEQSSVSGQKEDHMELGYSCDIKWRNRKGGELCSR